MDNRLIMGSSKGIPCLTCLWMQPPIRPIPIPIVMAMIVITDGIYQVYAVHWNTVFTCP